jgi:hypothetical protein
MVSDPYAGRGATQQSAHGSLAGAPQLSADASGVSWSAVFAGTAGAAALSLILLLLGAAFGFAVVSPWIGAGATAIGVGAILWLMLTHVVASGLGGYLAGRLRVKWTSVHSDEVYFRDTAHGFLTWSLSTIVVAALAGAALGGLLGQDFGNGGNGEAGERGPAAAMVEGAGMGVMAGAATGPGGERGLAYHVDLMFRTPSPDAEPLSEERRNMAIRVLAYAMVADELPERDRQFLAQQVAYHTGMGQQQAEQHVEDVYQDIQGMRDDMREAMEDAAQAAAWAFGWMFVALLMGAFFASLAATWGGRQRDSWVQHA